MKTSKILRCMPLFILAVGLAMALAGCGGNFGVAINEELNGEITAENASVDSSGSAGTFTIEAGETAVIEPSLDEGTIRVQFTAFDGSSDEDAGVEEAASGGEPAFEAEVSGTEPVQCDLAEGDYMITATVTEKANGTVLISKIVSGH